MEGEVLSLASSASLSLSATEAELDEPKLTEELGSQGADRLPSAEEQVTLITDSMTVTSTDQEKLLLLDKNTELRRINKELMKLNEEWDQVYRSATLGLQQRVEALELENLAIKTLNKKLLLKVEHQQSVKDFYEQALMQEMKKKQGLHDYIQHVESGLAPSEFTGTSTQTQIYEAEFQTEHTNHKHTLQENRRLRQKREEMRQQVALLQQQLKVYEDDFRRERSDKQMLQRLLKKKQSSLTAPVLTHRCNTEKRSEEGDKRTHGDRQRPQRKQHHPLCPKHQARPED